MSHGDSVRSRAGLAQLRRVVVKIGSRLLAEDLEGRVAALAKETRVLRERGIDVVIVTSGAIALGTRRLGLAARPSTIPGLQAVASVGQGHLIHVYERALAAHGLPSGQVLLTHDDVRNRRRYLNARMALSELLTLGAVPVINENDTVSVDEIKFGDNDRLAALTTSLVEAEALIILTDVDGLYAGDPKTGAALISEVTDLQVARSFAGRSVSGVGTGGMASKVEAAAIAGRFGVVTLIASGRRPQPVTELLDGAPVGTIFWPEVERMQSRKHWIAYALRPAGTVVVDAGARRALVEGKKSLLPSGITAVRGRFDQGDPVSVVDADGREIARGLCAYDASEVVKILGKRSHDLEEALGYRSVDEVIHRDDLVLL
jgi:glutamate 5-kinase